MGLFKRKKKQAFKNALLSLSEKEQKELCFIELIGQPGVFVHPTKNGKEYWLKYGEIGAAIWKEADAKKNIETMGPDQLRTVTVHTVLNRGKKFDPTNN